MNLTDLISQHLPDDLLSQIAGQAGISNPQQGVDASKSILTSLLQGLSHNTEDANGADSLLSALDRDHNGGVLNDLMGMFGGNGETQSNLMQDGMGILNHILGNNQQNVSQGMGQVLGIDSGKLSTLMTLLSPILMGILGKARAQKQIDQTNIQQVLGITVQTHTESIPGMDIFAKLFDKNGDGNVTDDLLQMGLKYFTNRS
ncbi:MAG: DUF937 domain-containing protein [Saprospiraceae bacterium]